MFIAMNRFKIVPDLESDFEAVWKARETYLDNVPGFISFNLLKGPQKEEYTLYASHTSWKSRKYGNPKNLNGNPKSMNGNH